MACHGFIVALPEIYHEYEPAGTAFSYEGKAGVDRGNELKVTKPIAAYDSDSAASVAWLASHPDCTGAVGVMGFCIGGHLAFRAAMNAGVRSAACFYATDIHKGSLGLGMSDNSLARAGELAKAGTEMMMIWGIQDPHVPLDGRVRVHASLSSAGVRFTWHEYNGQHAFMRDEGGRYDGELALHCYRMCVDLFHRTLHAGNLPVPGGLIAAGGESKH
jgi:carboxymethylenebutenolidase